MLPLVTLQFIAAGGYFRVAAAFTLFTDDLVIGFVNPRARPSTTLTIKIWSAVLSWSFAEIKRAFDH